VTAYTAALGDSRSHIPDRYDVQAPAPAAPHGSLCDAIAHVAREQFRRWRPDGGPALRETDRAASPILREYYRIGIGAHVTDEQMQSPQYQAAHPWSAVFISYVMRTAGAGPAFRYSAAHQAYIRTARENRLSGNRDNPFWAFRATEVAPRVGDLVCASRQNSGATYDNIAGPQFRATHCDVVTDVGLGRIRVIGGNRGQTVGTAVLRTLPDGRLDPTGSQAGFFAVIRCRRGSGRQGAIVPAWAPTMPAWAPTLPGPALSATPSSLEGRVQRVMDLLVNRYGYPVNGAAGIVGNLVAESQVQPNRIEGSHSATPMRAPDFSGRVRDFTPDEVQHRDFRRQRGPRRPGIGIAQWTSPDRRAGLFRHMYQGRQLGSAILSNIDAQVDYLVSELRGPYRSVNATLTRPGTTADQASDAVVLHFERPGAVLGKPVTDPGVQHVLGRRRRLTAQALQIYRAAHP
jgi:hypothetical protein